MLGVDAGKRLIMANLKAENPGPRYCHFPKRDDYGAAYFHGLLSERLQYDVKNRSHPWKWIPIPGHERNEPLDCRNYAMAAFEALRPDLDAIHQRLYQTKPQKAPAQIPKAPKKPPVKRRNTRVFDAW